MIKLIRPLTIAAILFAGAVFGMRMILEGRCTITPYGNSLEEHWSRCPIDAKP
jgi:hypothetical protein